MIRSLLAALVVIGLAMSVTAQETTTSVTAEIAVCTSIADRAPQGADSTFSVSVGSVYCWSKIVGAAPDATITHVWLREGQEMARVDLPVRSSAWRTWSQKNLYGKTGNWEVRIVDAGGNTIATKTFTVTP